MTLPAPSKADAFARYRSPQPTPDPREDLKQPETAVIYDTLAPVYDARYTSPEAQQENEFVADLVRMISRTPDNARRVLDIGAGTGLVLELGLSTLYGYYGIEPSSAMRDQLKAKFPEARVEHGTLLTASPHNTFDVAVALFGVGSYLTPEEYRRLHELLAQHHTSALVMTYRVGYWPDYYDAEPHTAPTAREYLVQLATAQHLGVLNNFDLWRMYPSINDRVAAARNTATLTQAPRNSYPADYPYLVLS